jgi:hypothetical protein
MSAIGVSSCPPFAKPPSVPGVIYDGNTVAWFKHNDMTNVIKDGANRVSQWSDKTGLGHHLLQVAGAAQPLWSANGLLFDGINDYMQCNPFIYTQPEMIYIVGRQITWSIFEKLIDGGIVNSGLIQNRGLTPDIYITTNVINFLATSNFNLNIFKCILILFNGANSLLQINNGAPNIGQTGANNMNNFTLGSSAIAADFTNIEVKEIILRRSADNATNRLQIYNYLKNANGL